MPVRRKENSKVVKSKSVSPASQQNPDKRGAENTGVKSKKARAFRKLTGNKTTTFITKTKTDKSLFEQKVRKANELLSKTALIDKRASAAG
jgi:hypothetical protein